MMISARLTFAVYLLAAGAGALLYRTSYEVDELHAKIATAQRQIVAEQENIQVLGAEWTYLTEPHRIEELAAKYLHLETTKPQRVAALHDLNRVVAQAEPAAPIAAPVATPAVVAVVTPAAPIARPVTLASATTVIVPRAIYARPSLQPAAATTPGSVKLLLASFQAGKSVRD